MELIIALTIAVVLCVIFLISCMALNRGVTEREKELERLKEDYQCFKERRARLDAEHNAEVARLDQYHRTERQRWEAQWREKSAEYQQKITGYQNKLDEIQALMDLAKKRNTNNSY